MRWGIVLPALALLLSAGCAEEPLPPVELQVGEHRISAVLPEGWEHLDYGDHHQLRQGFARIAIKEIRGSAETGPRRLGENEQRDIASRTPIRIGDREGLVVDTWDRLSHAHRKRFCFVRGEGRLLAFYMMQGEFETMQPALDALVASVTLDSTAQAVGEAQPQ